MPEKNSSTPKWVKGVFVFIAIVIGGSVLWWQMTQDSAMLRIDGHSFHITVAKTEAQLTQGLSGTKNLGANEAMVFAFASDGPQSMWMKDMNYPIDMVWLSSDTRVVNIVKNAQPSSYNSQDPSKSTRFQSSTPARYVIELPSGTIDKTGIQNGDVAGLPSGI
jgi:uncharacterized membrane protein (UPF0127 family)